MGGLVDKHSKKYQVSNSQDILDDSNEFQTMGRFRPEGLKELCERTCFTRREIQLMYRGFKQESPSGVVNKTSFKEIYRKYFPYGNATNYATYVFDAFDIDKNGSISFEEFVTGLSVLSRGTMQEKLEWVFALYDINHDGHITRDEMFKIVSAIYDMFSRGERAQRDREVKRHVDRVFQKMDINRDGIITMDEFMTVCQNDEQILQSFTMFDTQWY